MVVAFIGVVAMRPKVRGSDVQLDVADADEAIGHPDASVAKIRAGAAATQPGMEHVDVSAGQGDERIGWEPLASPQPRQDRLRGQSGAGLIAG